MSEKKKSYVGYQPKELNIQKLAMYIAPNEVYNIYGYKQAKLSKKTIKTKK